MRPALPSSSRPPARSSRSGRRSIPTSTAPTSWPKSPPTKSNSIPADAKRPGLSIEESGPICLPYGCLLLFCGCLLCGLLYGLLCCLLCRSFLRCCFLRWSLLCCFLSCQGITSLCYFFSALFCGHFFRSGLTTATSTCLLRGRFRCGRSFLPRLLRQNFFPDNLFCSRLLRDG